MIYSSLLRISIELISIANLSSLTQLIYILMDPYLTHSFASNSSSIISIVISLMLYRIIAIIQMLILFYHCWNILAQQIIISRFLNKMLSHL